MRTRHGAEEGAVASAANAFTGTSLGTDLSRADLELDHHLLLRMLLFPLLRALWSAVLDSVRRCFAVRAKGHGLPRGSLDLHRQRIFSQNLARGSQSVSEAQSYICEAFLEVAVGGDGWGAADLEKALCAYALLATA